jgi:hypothetical protein
VGYGFQGQPEPINRKTQNLFTIDHQAWALMAGGMLKAAHQVRDACAAAFLLVALL